MDNVEEAYSRDAELAAKKKLMDIQRELKVGKERWNEFGGYYSRNREDIIEAIKPLCFERDMLPSFGERVIELGNGWVYIEAIASITDLDTGYTITAKGYAREPETKPKMDASQCTGSASSYAGKRALGNLFAIDDSRDADNIESNADSPLIGECTACGTQFQFNSMTQMDSSACTCGNRQFRVV